MCEARIVRRGTPTEARRQHEVVLLLPEHRPRNSLAKIGMFTTPMAIMMESRPGPIIAAR